MLHFYNTATRTKERFKPLNQENVKVYYCGPTVYNNAHIGNLKNYTINDMIVRTLRFLGYKVNTAMNITDVDDKTIRDSQKAGEKLSDFTQKYTDLFLDDISKLFIQKADNIIPVTSVMSEIVEIINILIKKGYAYLADDGSIYYEISKFKKYGQFANLDFSGMKNSVRVDNDEYEKDNAADFVLWKSWKKEDGDNFWEENFVFENETKTLKGRPGWHIECSGVNKKIFGPQIDIHMGGEDLIFPHHQNEIAQCEAITGKTFAKYWLHSGHLLVNGKKMSKSANNFYTLTDIQKKYNNCDKNILHRALRFGFINGKYRDSIDFTFDKLDASINTIKKLDSLLKRIGAISEVSHEGVRKIFSQNIQSFIQDYIERLEDDFNIPGAFAVFFEFVSFVNSTIDSAEISNEELDAIIDMLQTFDAVFDILNFDLLEDGADIPEDILQKLTMRNEAKSQKNYDLSDKLRDEIAELGYKIVDDKSGSRLEKII